MVDGWFLSYLLAMVFVLSPSNARQGDHVLGVENIISFSIAIIH